MSVIFLIYLSHLHAMLLAGTRARSMPVSSNVIRASATLAYTVSGRESQHALLVPTSIVHPAGRTRRPRRVHSARRLARAGRSALSKAHGPLTLCAWHSPCPPQRGHARGRWSSRRAAESAVREIMGLPQMLFEKNNFSQALFLLIYSYTQL